MYAIAVSPRIASITAGELSDVSRVQPELSRVMARVKAVKALWLVRQHPDDIARYHAADLLGKVCMRARVRGSRGVAMAMRRARVWHRNRPLESGRLTVDARGPHSEHDSDDCSIVAQLVCNK